MKKSYRVSITLKSGHHIVLKVKSLYDEESLTEDASKEHENIDEEFLASGIYSATINLDEIYATKENVIAVRNDEGLSWFFKPNEISYITIKEMDIEE